MKTGKYKALVLTAFLISALNLCDTKASNQVVIIRPHHSNNVANTSTNQTINDLNETIKDMKYQLMCAQNEILRLQEMNQNLTKSLSEAEVNSQIVKKQNTSLEQDVNNKSKQLEEFSKQSNLKINMNGSEVSELKSQLSLEQKRNEDLTKLLSNINQEFSKLKQQYLSLNSQNGSNLTFKDVQIDSLKNQLSNKDIQIQELSRKISLLNTDLRNLKESYNLALSSQKEITPAETEINDLRNQVETYRKKADALSFKLANLNEELNKTKQQYISSSFESKNISNDKNVEINFLKSKLAFAEKQVQDSTNKINFLNEELLKTKDIYSSVISRQKELENLLTSSNKRADEIITEKDIQINKLKQDLADKSNTPTTIQTTSANNNYQKTESGFINVDNKKSAEDYYNIAKAYQSAKDYKESINNYKNAIAVNSSFGNAYKELGLVYAQIGDYKNASYSLKKYLYYSTNPKEQEVIKNFLLNIDKYLNY